MTLSSFILKSYQNQGAARIHVRFLQKLQKNSDSLFSLCELVQFNTRIYLDILVTFVRVDSYQRDLSFAWLFDIFLIFLVSRK